MKENPKYLLLVVKQYSVENYEAQKNKQPVKNEPVAYRHERYQQAKIIRMPVLLLLPGYIDKAGLFSHLY